MLLLKLETVRKYGLSIASLSQRCEKERSLLVFIFYFWSQKKRSVSVSMLYSFTVLATCKRFVAFSLPLNVTWVVQLITGQQLAILRNDSLNSDPFLVKVEFSHDLG